MVERFFYTFSFELSCSNNIKMQSLMHAIFYEGHFRLLDLLICSKCSTACLQALIMLVCFRVEPLDVNAICNHKRHANKPH